MERVWLDNLPEGLVKEVQAQITGESPDAQPLKYLRIWESLASSSNIIHK